MTEHQLDADFPEGFVLPVVGLAQRVGGLRQHPGGDVGDVGAGVAVLWGGFALGGGDQRVGEPVDLCTVVVEVVLPYHLGALGGQHPAQRITDGGPPGAADVDGPGRVGRDELQVDLGPGQCLPVPVGAAARDDAVDDGTLRRGVQAQVDEPGSGDFGRGHAGGAGQRLGEPSGQLTRVHPDLLAQL